MEEAGSLPVVSVLCGRQLHPHGQKPGSLKSGVNIAQGSQAPNHESGTNEKHKGESNLGYDKRISQARLVRTSVDVPGSALNMIGVYLRIGKGGCHSREDGRQQKTAP